MNCIYRVSEGGFVSVFSENGEKKKVLYQDNIEDVLNQENIVEMLSDLIADYKNLMEEDEKIAVEKRFVAYLHDDKKEMLSPNGLMIFSGSSSAGYLVPYYVQEQPTIIEALPTIVKTAVVSTLVWAAIVSLIKIPLKRRKALIESTKHDYFASASTIDYLEAMYAMEMKKLMELTACASTHSKLEEKIGQTSELCDSKNRAEQIKKDASLYWHAYQQMDRYLELIDEDNTQEELQETCDEVEINFDKLQDELHETYSSEEADFIATVVNEERIKRLSYTK